MRTRISLLATIVAFVLCVATPAFAQDEIKGDVGISYGVLRDTDAPLTFGAGYFMALAGDMNTRMRLVAEFGGNFKQIPNSGVNLNLRVINYEAGLRFVSAKETKVRPFVQFLAGGARLTGSIQGLLGSAVGNNGFAIQPGGGVDFKITKLLDGRAQFDYRAIYTQGSRLDEFRFGFGVVFPFGR